MLKTKIGLVQINNSFSGQNYLPYSVACLQGHVEANIGDAGPFEFLPPIYKRIGISAAVDRLAAADIVGFSTYVWNERISQEIARRLKEANPHILIIFGGPQVPDDSSGFFSKNPFVDLIVHGEGEQTFLDILKMYASAEFKDIAGISYPGPDGISIKTPPRTRFRDLADVPSPFLNGVLDQLVNDNPDETWIGLWETNRGCPFKCTYCDWGSAIAAKVTKFEVDRLYREIDWFSKNKVEFLFCCDANFGMLKRDVDISQYMVDVSQQSGYPQAFSVQNTKNATERAYETQKILSDGGLNKGVTLSLQSVNQDALRNIKRDNISLETYYELQRRFTQDGVETYSDMILGLPGETYRTFVDGISSIIETGQHNRIQFNNLSILPNAEMANPAYLKEFGMEVLESEIINVHGSRDIDGDDVREFQRLVVATNSMPSEDWRRVRAACWMTAFLHFDKLFQMPLILAFEHSSASYLDLFEAFMDVNGADYPVIAEIRDFFIHEAESIQKGGAEYVYSADWLGIYWPADEYMYIKLAVEDKLSAFFDEAAALLDLTLENYCCTIPKGALEDAVRVNRALLKQPNIADDTTVETRYDVVRFCENVRRGIREPLEARAMTVAVERSKSHYDDLNTWCQEVVWWGNKKGAYLYTNNVLEKQLSGHF